MSGRSGGKNWSASVLRRRGWTNELMKQLLPKPRILMSNGRPVRIWNQEEVRRAEKDRSFSQARRDPELRGAALRAAAPDVRHASRLLAAAWEEAGKDLSSAPWLLAGHYHAAILARLASVPRSRTFDQNQSVGQMREFLSLEENCTGKRMLEVLKNFLRAAPWMGECSDHAQARAALERYPQVLHSASEQVLAEFISAQPEADAEAMLRAEGFPVSQLLQEGLAAVWSVWYVHLGGTNTGKTYAGFQRLKQARSGVYLAPLRLLALEAQETLLEAGVDCSLTTGEEEDSRTWDTHTAATAEKLDLKRCYDVAVIDECQMIADGQRGYAWTRAILGVLSPEVHLCAAPEAEDLLARLIESCGDSFEVEVHKRTTPLICMTRTVDYRRVQPGDALITFSKVGVLSVAEDLRQSGKEPAIIYGALPYSTRRRQMEGFLKGEMEYIVSTDAIGMGLNLPIRRSAGS